MLEGGCLYPIFILASCFYYIFEACPESALQVGLALVVDGEIVLAVMGCPNWQEDFSNKPTSKVQGYKNILSESGIVMVAHLCCGTWAKRLTFEQQDTINVPYSWTRCFVDHYSLVHEARFCIPESQTWDSLPLSVLFRATTDADNIGDNQILLLPKCCGRCTLISNRIFFPAYMLVAVSFNMVM